MLIIFIKYLFLVITVLVGLAFFTLMERKVLGYTQSRKGPGKVGYWGILQPFSDAVKLFNKEQVMFSFINWSVFYFCSIFSLIFSLLGWVIIPFMVGFMNMDLGIIFFMCVLGVSVYSIAGAGWGSNSKYSLLGSLRSVAQSISYEVSLSILFLVFILLIMSFKLSMLSLYQDKIWGILFMGPVSFVWFASSLAETNRTPFDFSEGESELVSGFNTEYSGGSFSLFFMAEYGSILLMSGVFSIFFLGGSAELFSFYVKMVMIGYLFILIRSTLPRFRYDKLMLLAWKSFLSVSLGYLLFMGGVSVAISEIL